MLQTQKFKIVKNPLFPIKFVLEVSDDGVLNKGKMVKWSDMGGFCYGIMILNNSATNFLFNYQNKAGKKSRVILTTMKGPGSKKYNLFEQIYSCLDYGFQEKLTIPRS